MTVLRADLSLLWRQIRSQNRTFWRTPVAAFFTLALPVFFLALFSVLFGGSEVADGYRFAQFFAPAMAVFMLGLTGIPPLTGFFGKLYILQAAVESDLGWLAILLVVTSVVSAFYYLRVIVQMFMSDPEAEAASGDAPSADVADLHTAVITATAGATLALGIVGGGILAWAQSSVAMGLF